MQNSSSTPARLITLVFVIVPLAAYGQQFDLLPDIQPSPFRVTARTFAAGLPVENEMVTEVFTQRVGPTDLATIPDGSGDLVVTTYGGVAYRLSASGSRGETPFLDLQAADSPSVNLNFEVGGAHGFTSLAFHPDFATQQARGYAKFYTVESEIINSGLPDFVDSTKLGLHHDDALYEYTLLDPSDSVCGTECVASKRQVMRVLQPGWHHNLGDLEFDANGLLYVASADGSTSQLTAPFMSDNSQTLSTVFGNILRIDPLGSNSRNGEYGIPSSNPFVDDEVALDEIYAYGFRNPYRLNYDSETGNLFTTDTGELRVESAYQVVSGGNHGWNLKEGSFVYDKSTKTLAPDLDNDKSGVGDVAEANGLVEPIFEYDHDFGRAIIGTVMYRDPKLPYLDGTLVFGDFTGRLYYGDVENGVEYEFELAENSDSLPFQIHSINEDENGGLYVLGIQPGEHGFDGVIVKIDPCSGHTIPGDFNEDGNVAFDDFLILSGNFGMDGLTYSQGDADCDTSVQFADFLILSRNFGKVQAAAVPEPDTHLNFLILSAIAASDLRRRRR